MEHDFSPLLGLVGLFANPGAIGTPTCTPVEDAEMAASDPSHEPAYESVRTMLSLFPGLAPSHAPSPAF